MVNPAAAARRALPSVDRLLGSDAVAALIAAYGRTRVTEFLRRSLDAERARLGEPTAGAFDETRFLQSCAIALERSAAPSLKPVVNLTGTVLHNNLEPCAFAGPIPGMGAVVVDEQGNKVARGQVGELALSVPSIGLTRGFWQNRERYIETYWSRIPGLWVHGDFASIDEQGLWYIHGRSDDTIKIAGKRIGPAEVEAALLSTGKIAEAAAVGVPDPIKGSSVVCVCVPARNVIADQALITVLRDATVAALGASFRPKDVIFVSDLPKTRTMKIMRRLVRSVLLNEATGDLSGLVNPDSVDELRAQRQQA